MTDEWIEISGYGDVGPTYIVNVYGSPIVTFPRRRSFVAELWCDWEWVE